MGRLNELVQLLAESDVSEYGDGLITDITAARDEDDSVYTAKIEALEEGNAALTTQISSLKNELYDLSKLASATPSEDESEQEPKDTNIDDFFTEGE